MKTSIKLTAVFENAGEGDKTKANLIDALDLYLDTRRSLDIQNKNSASVIREEIVFT